MVPGTLSATLSGSYKSEPAGLLSSQHIPTSSSHISRMLLAPSAGSSPALNLGRQDTPGRGRQVPDQGAKQEGRWWAASGFRPWPPPRTRPGL